MLWESIPIYKWERYESQFIMKLYFKKHYLILKPYGLSQMTDHLLRRQLHWSQMVTIWANGGLRLVHTHADKN